jgi:protein tyrosine phosphatase
MTSNLGNCISQPSKYGKQRFSLCAGSKGPKALSTKCAGSTAAAAARRVISKLIGCSELDERRAEFEAPIFDLDEAMRALGEPIPRRILVERGLSPNDVVDHFDEQYAFLERRQTCRFSASDFTAARAVKNAMKNRYMDILPPDATRVRLSLQCDNPLSDYINANFIDGLAPGADRRYISTQGPTATTFADFWRMVWEQGSHVIVMLTREIEKGFVKCNRYWPVRGCCCCYGGLRVRMVSESVLLDGEVAERCFQVECAETGETRRVVQYQYTGWPDHGLPSSATGFLRVVQLVSEAERSLDTTTVAGETETERRTRLPPIIVHCSAGIGRSGTFIAVHASLERAAAEPRPCYTPVLLVDQMRRQRMGMVQTREQFRFIYVALHAAQGKCCPSPSGSASSSSSSSPCPSLVDFFSGSSCSSLDISKESFFFPSSSDSSVTSSDDEESQMSE